MLWGEIREEKKPFSSSSSSRESEATLRVVKRQKSQTHKIKRAAMWCIKIMKNEKRCSIQIPRHLQPPVSHFVSISFLLSVSRGAMKVKYCELSRDQQQCRWRSRLVFICSIYLLSSFVSAFRVSGMRRRRKVWWIVIISLDTLSTRVEITLKLVALKVEGNWQPIKRSLLAWTIQKKLYFKSSAATTAAERISNPHSRRRPIIHQT